MDTTFELPPNVHGVGIDDSKIQRELLSKFFIDVGIPRERIHILGGTTAELTGFDDWSLNFIYNHPNDYFLFIVDENLVVQDEQFSTHVTVSGSNAISNLRGKLLPDQEKRLLALIRSANDSAIDVAFYNSRAHGHLTKEPFRKHTCLEAIARIWKTRFPKLTRYSSENLLMEAHEKIRKAQDMSNASWAEVGKENKRARTIPELTRTLDPTKRRVSIDDFDMNESRHALKRPRRNSSNDSVSSDEGMITIDELYESIEEIDRCAALKGEEISGKWNIIWNKLHGLKGDLAIIANPSKGIVESIRMISNLKGANAPNHFSEKWHSIRFQMHCED